MNVLQVVESAAKGIKKAVKKAETYAVFAFDGLATLIGFALAEAPQIFGKKTNKKDKK